MSGKKRLAVLLLLLLSCCSVTGAQGEYGDYTLYGGYAQYGDTEAYAEYDHYAPEYAVIDNTTALNLRQGPGYNSKVLASYLKGEWVEIQGNYGDWDLVRVIRTGRTGYMVDGYLTRPGEGGEDIGVVTNQNARAFLNLREYPSYDADVLGIYYNGATCRVLGQENGWYQVEIDGMMGYFKEEFIRRTGGGGGISYAYAAASSGRTVNFRQGPSMNEKVLDKVPLGQVVEVLLKGSQFWYVRYNGEDGFMASSYLRETAAPGGSVRPVPAPSPAAAYGLVASAPGLNLREQPSGTSRVVTVCADGARVEILNPGLSWCRVRTASGETGFVMTRYLTVYGVPGTPVRQVSNQRTYVNFRSTPRIASGNVLAELNAGEEVTVLIPGDEWSKVLWEDQTGYMMSCFLK